MGNKIYGECVLLGFTSLDLFYCMAADCRVMTMWLYDEYGGVKEVAEFNV